MATTRSTFFIDHAAVAAAGRKLGLRYPIKARIAFYDRHPTDGRYVDFRDDVHHIAVDGEQKADEASETLWHELGHAKQVEDLGSRKALDAQIRRELKAAGIDLARGVRWWQSGRYRKMPLERKADEVARRYANSHPLCRPRDR